MNIRKCRQCGKEVDFDEPWCDHESMEESGWIDIQARINRAADQLGYAPALDAAVDKVVEQAAKELGWHAGETWKAQFRELYDSSLPISNLKEKHLSDLAHVYQHRGQDGKS